MAARFVVQDIASISWPAGLLVQEPRHQFGENLWHLIGERDLRPRNAPEDAVANCGRDGIAGVRVILGRQHERRAPNTTNPVFHVVSIDDAVAFRHHLAAAPGIDHEAAKKIRIAGRVERAAPVPRLCQMGAIRACLHIIDRAMPGMAKAARGINVGASGKHRCRDAIGRSRRDLDRDDRARVMADDSEGLDLQRIHEFHGRFSPAFDRWYARKCVGITEARRIHGGRIHGGRIHGDGATLVRKRRQGVPALVPGSVSLMQKQNGKALPANRRVNLPSLNVNKIT